MVQRANCATFQQRRIKNECGNGLGQCLD